MPRRLMKITWFVKPVGDILWKVAEILYQSVQSHKITYGCVVHSNAMSKRDWSGDNLTKVYFEKMQGCHLMSMHHKTVMITPR